MLLCRNCTFRNTKESTLDKWTFFLTIGFPLLFSGDHGLNLHDSPLYGHGAGFPMACHTSLQCKKLRLLETWGWQPMLLTLWCRVWPHQARGWHHQAACLSWGEGGRTSGKPRKKQKGKAKCTVTGEEDTMLHQIKHLFQLCLPSHFSPFKGEVFIFPQLLNFFCQKIRAWRHW